MTSRATVSTSKRTRDVLWHCVLTLGLIGLGTPATGTPLDTGTVVGLLVFTPTLVDSNHVSYEFVAHNTGPGQFGGLSIVVTGTNLLNEPFSTTSFVFSALTEQPANNYVNTVNFNLGLVEQDLRRLADEARRTGNLAATTALESAAEKIAVLAISAALPPASLWLVAVNLVSAINTITSVFDWVLQSQDLSFAVDALELDLALLRQSESVYRDLASKALFPRQATLAGSYIVSVDPSVSAVMTIADARVGTSSPITAVPEPGTVALIGVGLTALAGATRRYRARETRTHARH